MVPPRAETAVGSVFGVLTDRRTYGNLVYILLAAPLGLFYYILVSVGLVVGLALSFFLVGLVILFGTVVGVRGVAAFERRLANGLLGVGLQPPDDLAPGTGVTARTRARQYLDAPSTWRGLGFVFIKPVVGIVALVLSVILVWALSLVAAPFRYPYEAEFVTVGGEPVVWAIATPPEAALAAIVGVSIAVGFLHLSNGYAYVCGRIAAALLGREHASRPGGSSAPSDDGAGDPPAPDAGSEPERRTDI